MSMRPSSSDVDNGGMPHCEAAEQHSRWRMWKWRREEGEEEEDDEDDKAS